MRISDSSPKLIVDGSPGTSTVAPTSPFARRRDFARGCTSIATGAFSKDTMDVSVAADSRKKNANPQQDAAEHLKKDLRQCDERKLGSRSRIDAKGEYSGMIACPPIMAKPASPMVIAGSEQGKKSCVVCNYRLLDKDGHSDHERKERLAKCRGVDLGADKSRPVRRQQEGRATPRSAKGLCEGNGLS